MPTPRSSPSSASPGPEPVQRPPAEGAEPKSRESRESREVRLRRVETNHGVTWSHMESHGVTSHREAFACLDFQSVDDLLAAVLS